MSKPVSTIPSGWISLIKSVFFHVFFFYRESDFCDKTGGFQFFWSEKQYGNLKNIESDALQGRTFLGLDLSWWVLRLGGAGDRATESSAGRDSTAGVLAMIWVIFNVLGGLEGMRRIKATGGSERVKEWKSERVKEWKGVLQGCCAAF